MNESTAKLALERLQRQLDDPNLTQNADEELALWVQATTKNLSIANSVPHLDHATRTSSSDNSNVSSYAESTDSTTASDITVEQYLAWPLHEKQGSFEIVGERCVIHSEPDHLSEDDSVDMTEGVIVEDLEIDIPLLSQFGSHQRVIDTNDSNSSDARELELQNSLGIPPCAPHLSIPAGVVDDLFLNCWEDVVLPELDFLVDMISRVRQAKGPWTREVAVASSEHRCQTIPTCSAEANRHGPSRALRGGAQKLKLEVKSTLGAKSALGAKSTPVTKPMLNRGATSQSTSNQPRSQTTDLCLHGISMSRAPANKSSTGEFGRSRSQRNARINHFGNRII